MKRYCLPFLLLVFLPLYKNSAFYEFLNDTTTEFSKTKEKEYGAKEIGTSGSIDDGVVNRFGLYFAIKQCASLDLSRELAVDFIESLLKLVNSNEQLRPYLSNYPFKPFNVRIIIDFEDQNNEMQKEGITTVSLEDKGRGGCVLEYYAYDPKKKDRLIHREPYEEAYKIVKESGALDSKPSETVSKTPQRPLMPFEKKLLKTK